MSSEETNNSIMSDAEETSNKSSPVVTAMKLVAAGVFLFSAVTTFSRNASAPLDEPHRRLAQVIVGDSIPTYMDPLMKDLKARKKLMEETPPEEVKYWFEYTGALQVCCLFVSVNINLVKSVIEALFP